MGGRRLAFEFEVTHKDGDHDIAATTTRNAAGSGVFAQMRERSTRDPLYYSLRFENFGEDYRPHGAVITPDRLAVEFRGGWIFDGGLCLEGRFLDYEDGFGPTLAKLNTRISGLNLSGPLLGDLAPASRAASTPSCRIRSRGRPWTG